MTDKNLFKIAARRKSRFASTKGDLTAEQLYGLTLPDLDFVARNINTQLKDVIEGSFIEVKPDPRKGILTDQLALVVEVIADKQADIAAATKRAEQAGLRRALTDALARAEADKLAGTAPDELRKQIAALDAVED